MLDIDAMMDDIRLQIERLQAELESLERLRESAQERGFYAPDGTHDLKGGAANGLFLGATAVRPGGRRKELRDFLFKHGPMKAPEIAKKSKIPRGTIDYLLAQVDHFERLDDGTWKPKIYALMPPREEGDAQDS